MKSSTERHKKRTLVIAQLREIRETSHVTTAGGHRLPVWAAFRCLYCGEFFARKGAEEHFGMTRENYFKKQKRKEARCKKSIR